MYVVLDFYLELKQILNDPQIVNSERDKKFICYEILQGIAFLHKNYIFHRVNFVLIAGLEAGKYLRQQERINKDI